MEYLQLPLKVITMNVTMKLKKYVDQNIKVFFKHLKNIFIIKTICIENFHIHLLSITNQPDFCRKISKKLQ